MDGGNAKLQTSILAAEDGPGIFEKVPEDLPDGSQLCAVAADCCHTSDLDRRHLALPATEPRPEQTGDQSESESLPMKTLIETFQRFGKLYWP